MVALTNGGLWKAAVRDRSAPAPGATFEHQGHHTKEPEHAEDLRPPSNTQSRDTSPGSPRSLPAPRSSGPSPCLRASINLRGTRRLRTMPSLSTVLERNRDRFILPPLGRAVSALRDVLMRLDIMGASARGPGSYLRNPCPGRGPFFSDEKPPLFAGFSRRRLSAASRRPCGLSAYGSGRLTRRVSNFPFHRASRQQPTQDVKCPQVWPQPSRVFQPSRSSQPAARAREHQLDCQQCSHTRRAIWGSRLFESHRSDRNPNALICLLEGSADRARTLA
jgi:hypothetical protein